MRLLERENDLTPRWCYLCHGAIRPDEVMEDNRGDAQEAQHA